MKKILLTILLLIIAFYDIFPQGISFFGYSFIFTSAVVGLGLYAYNKYPYNQDLISIIGAYFPIFLFSFFAGYMISFYDPWIVAYPKSQFAWIFSTYLIISLFFYIYPKGTFVQIVYLLIGVVLLQCIIALAMHENEAVKGFFESLQMADAVAQMKRDQTEGARLLGYGTAFFGSGIVCGFALILIVYVVMTQNLNFIKLSLAAAIYIFIFYVGLISARTTTVGLAASIVLFIILFLTGSKKVSSAQTIKFVVIGIGFASIGYTLCYLYFPEFSDWAFELFTNYEQSGELRTQSSDGLSHMFILPYNMGQWMHGIGGMAFFGTDVGYSRLLFYFGLPGTLAYFFYQIYLMRLCVTKNTALNLTLIIIFVYNLALNVKGLSDLNHFVYFFVFYFIYYKNDIYIPYLKKLGKLKEITLRNAVQGSTPRRRL